MTRPLLRTERGLPPHFAGRVDELDHLKQRLAMVVETGDASDGLALVTGVPGVGKTALARTFASSCGAIAIVGGTSELDSALHLFLNIGKAIGRETGFKRIADVDPRPVGANVGIAIVKVGGTREHVRATPGFASMLRQSKAEGLWDGKDGKALVLVIDELQTLEQQQAKLLRDLHQGLHECPILVVGVGLQHTRSVLSRHGVSRVARGIQLGPLRREDTREAIAEGLAALDREAPDHVVERLAQASHDFPQHVNCYLSAALDVVDNERGWAACGVLARVVAKGDALRGAYYDTRLEIMQDGYDRVLPVIEHMRKHNSPILSKRAAIHAIDDAGMDGKSAVEDAIAHGVLTHGKRGDVSFGIPSFHKHMVALLAER